MQLRGARCRRCHRVQARHWACMAQLRKASHIKFTSCSTNTAKRLGNTHIKQEREQMQPLLEHTGATAAQPWPNYPSVSPQHLMNVPSCQNFHTSGHCCPAYLCSDERKSPQFHGQASTQRMRQFTACAQRCAVHWHLHNTRLEAMST
jgi:hypothetical protein